MTVADGARVCGRSPVISASGVEGCLPGAMISLGFFSQECRLGTPCRGSSRLVST